MPNFLTASEWRYLNGPIVQPRLNGWDFPSRLSENMSLIRWMQILRGHYDKTEHQLASEDAKRPTAAKRRAWAAALGSLRVSCVSLEAPLDQDWADIRLYLGLHVFPRWFLAEGQSALEAIGLSRPIELNRQQAEDRRRFRRWRRAKIEGQARKSFHRKQTFDATGGGIEVIDQGALSNPPSTASSSSP